ncbi:alpha/beta fold hydrolase [Streptomyces brasiliensis]|uniref:Alpha/beta hydrolase n=1 Tax=Streptomyces brasiliensis TaxID=1954 RepID=A0A917P7L6_9ACTN|nr:alpha/beta hydrolase [Streptomyces brasiliensis]GGJ65636.1 alpha/beta hydrolase [Streptomyces brasiliensis]
MTLPLVLVPALASDDRLWQPVVERLGDSVTTHIIQGIGDSIEAMADRILDEAPDQFCLAGISMGGYVSLEIALRATNRVRALALLNTSAIAAPPARRENSLKAIALVESGQFEATARHISGAVAPGRPDVTAVAQAMALELGPDVFKAQQQAVAGRRDRRTEIERISVPTLVLGGDRDLITPFELSKELAALIPDADLVELDGIGHLSTLEDPDRVASSITRWLNRGDAS